MADTSQTAQNMGKNGLIGILLVLTVPIMWIGNSAIAQESSGGAACVVAKKMGDSLAIEWVTGEASVSAAISGAKLALRKRGYEYVFSQANSDLAHAWMIVVKTEYKTHTGRQRTSYGCGFSAVSEQDAEEMATSDLRSYSWGWLPKHGYQVIERQRY